MLASWSPLLVLLALSTDGHAAHEGPESVLIHAERVIVRPGEVLEGVSVLVEDGVIVAVGTGLTAPAGAHEVKGHTVCAGFVNPWSNLGLDPGSAWDFSTSPATRTADAVDPWADLPERSEALRGGVTSVRAQAGSMAFVGGVGAVVRSDSDGPLLLEDACVSATIGVRRGNNIPDVFDRISEVERLAGMIEGGRRYAESWTEYRFELEEWEAEIAKAAAKYEKDFKKTKKSRDKKVKDAEKKGKEFKESRFKEDKKPRSPKYDPESEVMARVANGELPLVVEIHRAPELRTLLNATKGMDRLRLVLAGATDAAQYADELASRRIPVIVWPDPDGSSYTETDSLALAGELAAADVSVLIGTGGSTSTRDLRLFAALAAGYGLDRDAALAAITTGPARAFDLDSVGTVERGKHADLIVLDGDPLSTATRVQYVLSHGEIVIQP